MGPDGSGLPAERVAGDVAAVADAHGLSAAERGRLLRVVTGAVPGNRDRPIFLLAGRVRAAGAADLFDLILPGQKVLGRLEAAMLDFLLTAAVADVSDFEGLLASVAAAPQQDDPVRALASALSRVLHGYRMRMLPEARHHNLFTAIRRFYATHRPEDPEPHDGDALDLWEAEGTRAFLTRYVTALTGLADYTFALRLAASWRTAVSLDAPDAGVLPADAGTEMDAEDPLAPEVLTDSLAALAGGPVKLLLARELDEIAALAALAGAVQRWPLATLAALGFGPVQNALTEAMRRAPGAPDIGAQLARAEGYADLRDRHGQLADKLLDALHLAHLCALPEGERASARSSLPVERRRRIDAVQRRASFAQMDERARADALMALVPPLTALKGLVEAARVPWATLSIDSLATAQGRHRARFHAKFDALYGAQQEGVTV